MKNIIGSPAGLLTGGLAALVGATAIAVPALSAGYPRNRLPCSSASAPAAVSIRSAG